MPRKPGKPGKSLSLPETIVWSGRLVMPASSLVTTLAMLSLPLYRLWNASGFVMLLGIIVAGWLASTLDAIVAYLSMRNPRLDVDAPQVTVLGEPCRVEITDASPSGAVVSVHSTATGSADNTVRVGHNSSVVIHFDRRAAHSVLLGEMVVIGPLGIASCRRRFQVALPGGLAVGPPPASVAATPDLPSDEESSERHLVSRGSDLTRSVRPYRRGDAQALVAWKASARSGELMVRELEGTVDQELVLAVQVAKASARASGKQRHQSDDSARLSEDAINRAAGYAIEAIRQGRAVRLVTNQQQPGSIAGGKPPRFGAHKPQFSAGKSTVHDAPVRNETEVIARLAAVVEGEDLRRRPELLEAMANPVFFVGPSGDHVLGRAG